jgi:DNA-binding transcriptional LysR family regulator
MESGVMDLSAPPAGVAERLDRFGFDLRSLLIFVEVCTAGSMSAAARRLDLTQPGVSQAIRALEATIGAPLFDRSIKPLALTLAGDLLHERAVRLLEEARQIVPAVRLENRTRLSSIRIGVPDSVAGLLTQTMATLLQSKVRHLAIGAGSPAAHRASFLARQLTMIVTNEPMEDAAAFEVHTLVREPFIRILPAARADLAGQGLAENAQALPLIRYIVGSNAGRRIDRHLRRLRLELPRTIDVDRTLQMTTLVEGGAGWAITTPLCLLEARPDYRRLAIAPMPPPGISRRLTLVAYRDELGSLPRQMAAALCRTLEAECMPRLTAHMPWLATEMRFGAEE